MEKAVTLDDNLSRLVLGAITKPNYGTRIVAESERYLARCLSSTSEMTTSSSCRDSSAVVGVVVEDGEHGSGAGAY